MWWLIVVWSSIFYHCMLNDSQYISCAIPWQCFHSKLNQTVPSCKFSVLRIFVQFRNYIALQSNLENFQKRGENLHQNEMNLGILTLFWVQIPRIFVLALSEEFGWFSWTWCLYWLNWLKYSEYSYWDLSKKVFLNWVFGHNPSTMQ